MTFCLSTRPEPAVREISWVNVRRAPTPTTLKADVGVSCKSDGPPEGRRQSRSERPGAALLRGTESARRAAAPAAGVRRVRLIQQLYAAGLPSRVVREVL